MPDRKAYQGLPAVVEPRPVPPPHPPERPPARRLERRPARRPKPLGPPWPWVLEYPDWDGEPMSDDEWQGRAMDAVFHALDGRFKSDEHIHVAKDLLVYYDESNPNRALAPDVFVTRGVAPGLRESFQIWEEGRTPEFVLEVASPSTATNDATKKKDLYAQWGVREYWLFDPRGGLHEPRLQGFVLVEHDYRRLPAREIASGGLALSSWLLGLELRLEEGRLRLWDVEAERYLLTPDEDREARVAAEARIAAAKDRAQADVAARRAAEDQAQADVAARRAAESRVAVADDRTAAAESRAQAAEARLAELEAALRELQQSRDPSA